MQTINDLINEIYEDNYSHFEFENNMGGEPCDCHLHITMNTIAQYAGIDSPNEALDYAEEMQMMGLE